MCASDIHEHAKENGLPWAICKGMDTFSPIGRFIAPKEIPDPENVNLKLVVSSTSAKHPLEDSLRFLNPF